MLIAMAQPSDPAPAHPHEACAEQRAEVRALCDGAVHARQASADASERARRARRDIVAARHRHERSVLAADPARRFAEKDAARKAYRAALKAASSEADLAEAAATWAGAVDRANRNFRRAHRSLTDARETLSAAEEVGRELDRLEYSARMAAEAADVECLEARVRLASCEEQQAQGRLLVEPTASLPDAAEAALAASRPPAVHRSVRDVEFGPPLVIHALLRGDSAALEETAAQVADETGLETARARLHLQELIDGLVAAASEQGHLVFDEQHPFWSQISGAEAADIIAALTRLGFQFEPSVGWHAGRAPAPSDLTMAMAYAGLDGRSVRRLPSSSELQELPRSISIDAASYLAAGAPSLSLDDVVRVLGRRSEPLGPLWDEWGQVRPILLSERPPSGDAPAAV